VRDERGEPEAAIESGANDARKDHQPEGEGRA
jgi:hypothetical protein